MRINLDNRYGLTYYLEQLVPSSGGPYTAYALNGNVDLPIYVGMSSDDMGRIISIDVPGGPLMQIGDPLGNGYLRFIEYSALNKQFILLVEPLFEGDFEYVTRAVLSDYAIG